MCMDQRIEKLKGSNEINQLCCGIHAGEADLSTPNHPLWFMLVCKITTYTRWRFMGHLTASVMKRMHAVGLL